MIHVSLPHKGPTCIPRVKSAGSSCPNCEELCRSDGQGGPYLAAPSSTCRTSASQPKLASNSAGTCSRLPAASVNWLLRESGSGASTASNVVPTVRFTCYNRESKAPNYFPSARSDLEYIPHLKSVRSSCPNCEELYRSDKQGGPYWPGLVRENLLRCQKFDFREPAAQLPTAVLSAKANPLQLSNLTLELWTHVHVHRAHVPKQPAFPKSIFQLPIYKVK